MLLSSCAGPEPPLAPRDALVAANTRISRILAEHKETANSPVQLANVEAPEDPRQVSFWFYSHPLISAHFARPENVDSFNASHSSVVLDAHYIGDWFVAVQKLTVSLAAGDLPDVALVKRSLLARLAAAKLIEPLETYLPAALMAELRPEAAAAFTVDGHLYALPADGFCSVLYVNRSIVKGNIPTTWRELLETAASMQSDKSGNRGSVYAVGDLPFLETLWSTGGDVCENGYSLLDRPPALNALEFVLSLRDEEIAHPDAFGRADRAMDLFLQGRVAMTVASSEHWSVAKASRFPVEIAPVPGRNGPISHLYADSAIVVFRRYAQAKRQPISELLKYLIDMNMQGYAAHGKGSEPVHRGVMQYMNVRTGLEEAYDHGRFTPLIPAWSEIEFELARYLDRAYRYEAAH
ncbi:MAG: extracellular solute-binding protein [Candidatus Hydrogenedentes bacterium]|nr:extracellular solute-binding protein [Candidatus Hydrogenedentota bacterium]